MFGVKVWCFGYLGDFWRKTFKHYSNIHISYKMPFSLGCIKLFHRKKHRLCNQDISNWTSGISTRNSTYVDYLFKGLIKGQRSCLASAITLVESQHPQKKKKAQELLSFVLREAKIKYERLGQKSLSFRIGITGPPGAGKSTFIEAFGKFLTGNNRKVAVLTVDPSSSTTGGSLLGDKTRMSELSCDSNAYIRPSPTSGCLGGVTRNTNEVIALCECAGYEIVIVETVGVGQSEYNVAHMIDMFVLMIPPAAGDELQALKKGIIELVDVIVINKADGNLLPDARRIQADYTSALKFIKHRSKLWQPRVLRVSSVTKEGISDLWDTMKEFQKTMLESGEYERKRKNQYYTWMWTHIETSLLYEFRNHSDIKVLLTDIEKQVMEGITTPGQASDILINKFLNRHI